MVRTTLCSGGVELVSAALSICDAVPSVFIAGCLGNRCYVLRMVDGEIERLVAGTSLTVVGSVLVCAALVVCDAMPSVFVAG